MASSPESTLAPPSQVNPLAALHGKRPDAPAWFTESLAQAPERSRVPVSGANIEVLSWGERGAPGLLLLHGLTAHADWWSHIAPFLAKRYRVAALSWSGMGGSDWRESYSAEIFLQEILAVAQASGLFESVERPLVVGHSFGGSMLLAATAAFGERLKGAVVVDSYLHPEGQWYLPPSPPRPLPVYSSLEAALARFRFTPSQACVNLFIADHIARASLKAVPSEAKVAPFASGSKAPQATFDNRTSEEQREPGWTWRFDPRLVKGCPVVPISVCLARPRSPLAFIAGARSPLTDATVESFVRRSVPQGTPWIDIPDSSHHVPVDQPLALVAALSALFECWPAPLPSHPVVL
jgi:pimeloyl-ACP methyl ester carboxylesterase